MKAVEGIDLKNELGAVRTASLEEQKTKLRTKIQHILGKHSEAAGTVVKLEKDLAKAKESLDKHQKLLALLEAGDWNAIQEEKQQGGGQPPKPEAAE